MGYRLAVARPVTQRLIMIGRALLRSPELIILDEPTANLPRPEVDLLFSIVRPLAGARASVIWRGWTALTSRARARAKSRLSGAPIRFATKRSR
jgi:ABC-type branched-subunit amino acid transport system ATPase component